jgi:delta8-fatty-acid desaturase
MSFWKATHNTHHCATNSVDKDPDIQHTPFLAVDESYLKKPVYSTYHERFLASGRWSKILIPFQARLYYLIMSLARINLYVQSYIFLLRGSKFVNGRVRSNRKIELLGLLIFALWFGCLVSSLPWTSWRILFVLISHSLAGILHVQITLSHFAMPVYSGKAHPLETDSFLEHQLKTCLDIDCPEALDFFHGGLQHQLPHHLFPRVPRCHLRRLKDMVEEFCDQNNLTYVHMDFVSANKLLIKHLASVSEECRRSLLSDLLNARG